MICRSSASSASRRSGAIGAASPASPSITGSGMDSPSVLIALPLDASDIGAAGAKLLFHALEAAIQVIDAADRRLTFGHKTGDDQRHGGAKIRRHHRPPLQLLDAAHHRLA